MRRLALCAHLFVKGRKSHLNDSGIAVCGFELWRQKERAEERGGGGGGGGGVEGGSFIAVAPHIITVRIQHNAFPGRLSRAVWIEHAFNVAELAWS